MKKVFALINSAIFYLFFATPAFAQETINLQQAQQGTGVAAGTALNTVLQNAFTIIFTIAALLVLVMLIWGAISWIMSGGDKDAVANARKRIVNALIGLAILALAFFIVRIVGQIVGFNILTNLKLPALGGQPLTTATQAAFDDCALKQSTGVSWTWNGTTCIKN